MGLPVHAHPLRNTHRHGRRVVRALARGIACAVALLACAGTARADNCEWTGSGADNKWSTDANWKTCHDALPEKHPQNDDTVIFPDGAAQPANVDDLPGLAVRVTIIGLGGAPGFAAWNITGATGVTVTVRSILADSPVDAAGHGPTFQVPIIAPATSITNRAGRGELLVGDIQIPGSVAIFPESPITVGGRISGGVSGMAVVVGVVGSSVLTLSDNSYVGSTEIQGGTLVANTSRALGGPAAPGDFVSVGLNGRLQLSDGVVIDRKIALNNGRVVVPDGATATVTGPVDVFPGVFEIQGTLTITGQIQSTEMPKLGDGALIVSNATNHWDVLRIAGGTVRAGVAGAFPIDSAVRLLDPAKAVTSATSPLAASLEPVPPTLDLNGFDVAIGSLSGDEIGRILLGSHTLTVNPVDTQLYAGTIAGTGNLVKIGNGVQVLSGSLPNTYTGTTTVQAGTLGLQKAPGVAALSGPVVVTGGILSVAVNDNQIADAAPVTVNAPGVFRLDADHETIGSLTGNGQVLVGQGTLAIGANNTSTTFDGTFAGDAALGGQAEPVYFRVIKVGTGTLTLTGESRLSDQAVVDAGTLVLDGKLNGSGVLLRGGTLAGTGTIFDNDGLHTFASLLLGRGGAISPGSNPGPNPGPNPGQSPGILHADAADLAQGSTFVVQLNGLTPGTGYDQLDLVNSLTLGADARLEVTRAVAFAPPPGAAFTIVKVAPGQSVNGTFTGLPEGGTLEVDRQHFRITYQGGPAQNSVVLTALEEAPPPTYFLSEGATGGFFDEDLLIANPNDAAAPVTLTFSKEDGEQVVATRTVPAQSHLTVHVDQIPGLEATAASVQVTSEARLPLVVERSMFWDTTYYAGHTGSAVDQPGPDWLFAEGSQGFFDTFVLVINPNATPTDVTFTFFRENETPVVKTVTVDATTRLTLYAGDVPDLVNRSFGIAVHAAQPIMAERSMYFGTTPARLWGGGTESAGVTAASTHWFLAEGATGGFFDTFVLLSNPQNTAANVALQYLLDTGETVTVPKTIPANTRLTINIEAEDDVRLHNAAVSTVVTSDLPIIAERSMYWPGATQPFGEGHNSFGVVDTGTTWGLAEGRIGGPLNFHTYILLANPQTTAAEVTVNYLRENGTPITKTYTVAPTSRFNIDTNSITDLHDESFGAVITVTNGVPIIVERSMYWDSNGVQFSGGTNATGIRLIAP